MNKQESNRRNAQHSTGPNTEAGKSISSLNALKHGLTSHLVVMPNEDMELYLTYRKGFFDDYQPQGATESQLVQVLVDTSWRINRVVALETQILTISYAPSQVIDGLYAQSKAIANLSLHSGRLSREFERTAEFLRQLQQARREQEAKAAGPAQPHTEEGEPANPSNEDNDGFVFLPAQLTPAQRLRGRRKTIEKAVA